MHPQLQYLMTQATSESLAQCDATIDDLDDTIDRMEAEGDWDTCNTLMTVKGEIMQVRENLRVRLQRMMH